MAEEQKVDKFGRPLHGPYKCVECGADAYVPFPPKAGPSGEVRVRCTECWQKSRRQGPPRR
ncbi:MAG: hypothetical protein FJ044_00700 [Candidatus Cloacimonetes bacterium]|nr:hypothetical protein [Candidatus Cloacimonadota bacterium]